MWEIIPPGWKVGQRSPIPGCNTYGAADFTPSCDIFHVWSPSVHNVIKAFGKRAAPLHILCSCPGGATRSHRIGLLWERLSQLVSLGLLFLQLLGSYTLAQDSAHTQYRTVAASSQHLPPTSIHNAPKACFAGKFVPKMSFCSGKFVNPAICAFLIAVLGYNLYMEKFV